MSILVSGGAGFIGAALANAYSADGADVHVLVRPGSSAMRIDAGGGITRHDVDVADLDDLAPVIERIDPTVVINCAASGYEAAQTSSHLQIWRDTVFTTVSLLEALRRRPPRRLVHVCSALVYAPSHDPHREDESIGPTTQRGTLKAAAWLEVQQWQRRTGATVTTVRPSSVYGPGEAPARVIPTLLGAMRGGTTFRTRSATSARDFVHVDDVIAGIRLAAQLPAAANRTFNLGTGIATSVSDLIATAERIAGRPLTIDSEALPPRDTDGICVVADTTRAQAVLGWTARIDLEAGLRRLWAST